MNIGNLNPCVLTEAFYKDIPHDDISHNRDIVFIKDYDTLFPKQSDSKKDSKKDYKKDDKEWLDTEKGIIYIGVGVAGLITILIVLQSMRKQ